MSTAVFLLLAILCNLSQIQLAFRDRDFKRVIELYDPFEEDTSAYRLFITSCLRAGSYREIVDLFTLEDLPNLSNDEFIAYAYALFNVPGEAHKAIFTLHAAARRFPELVDWLLYLALQKEAEVENFDAAMKTLQELLNGHPYSPYTEEAVLELVGHLVGEDRCSLALEVLRNFKEKGGKFTSRDRQARSILFRAKAYQKLGEKKKARRLFAKLLVKYPSTPYALDAIPYVRGHYLEKGKALYLNGRYKRAWRYLRYVKPKKREAIYYRLLTLYRIGWRKRFLREAMQFRKRLRKPQRDKIDFLVALTYEKIRKDKRAVRKLLHLIDSRTQSDKASFEISLLLFENRNTRWANGYVRKFGEKVRKAGKPYGLFRAGLSMLVLGREREAQELLMRAAADTGAVGAAALYWLYRISGSDSLKAGIAERQDFSYYTWRSGAIPDFPDIPLKTWIKENFGTRKVDLRLYRIFALLGEVEKAKRFVPKDPVAYYCAMKIADEMGVDYLKVHYGIKLLLEADKIGKRPPMELVRDIFPVIYRSYLLKLQDQLDLDWQIMLSLVREESRFNPKAVSPKGAIGLAQLMPFTAERVLGRKVEEEELFDAKTNLRAGAIYLARLIDEFRSYALALAAYNAGPHRVREWIRRFGNVDDDIFTEFIPFRETRKYVKRVLRSYYLYTSLAL